MIDQASMSSKDAGNHGDASAALLSDHNQSVQAPSSENWLSTIVDYVPDKLGAPKFVSNVLPTLFKTAALFYPGPVGAASYVAMSALEQAHPGDTLGNQAEDLALGATKGALMAGAFRATAELPTNAIGLAGRGVTLGVASRFLDAGLDRHTYVNPNTGAFDFSNGFSNVLKTTFQPGALAIDAATFAVAGGLAKQVGVLTKGALATNYAATNAITGGIFGFSSGAVGELRQEQLKNQSISPLSIFGQGLESGAVMAVAAIPGGLKMQHDFNMASSAQDSNDSASANGRRIIPGPGRDQQPMRSNAQVADQNSDRSEAGANTTATTMGSDSSSSGAKSTDAVVTESAQGSDVSKSATDSSTDAEGEGRGPTFAKPTDSVPRVEFRMDQDGNMLLNPGNFKIQVNGERIPAGQETSIKPSDSVQVDLGDRYDMWKTLSLGKAGNDATIEGFPIAPSRSVLFDFSALNYMPDAKTDANGTLAIQPTHWEQQEGSTVNYPEPGSAIKVDAQGNMVLSTKIPHFYKVNGQFVDKGETPIHFGDKLETDVGDRYAIWKPLNWSTIYGQPAIEGRALPAGRELRFDPSVWDQNPKSALDPQGRMVVSGPHFKLYLVDDDY
jgi:hypothetical protein